MARIAAICLSLIFTIVALFFLYKTIDFSHIYIISGGLFFVVINAAILILSFTRFVNVRNLDAWALANFVITMLGIIACSLYLKHDTANNPDISPAAIAGREDIMLLFIFPCLQLGLIAINGLGIFRFAKAGLVNIVYLGTVFCLYYILLGEEFFSSSPLAQLCLLIFASFFTLAIAYSREKAERLHYINSKRLGVAQRRSEVAREKSDQARIESEQARKETEQLMELFSNINVVTDTPNRKQLQSSLTTYMGNTEYGISLVLLKLSKFKEINNTLGHDRCDLLLQLLALKVNGDANLSSYELLPIGNNLKQLPVDIAVIEGTTFALIVDSIASNEVNKFSRHMRDSTSGTIDFEGALLNLQMQVGVSSFDPEHDAKSAQSLIHEAQVGLSLASSREDRVGVYLPELDPFSQSRISLMGKLKKAIEENALELYYQPKINFRTKEVMGAEALLRWRNEEGGFHNPEEFVSLAESTGVIRSLTHWVIKEGFNQVAGIKKLFPNASLSMNMSILNLREDDFIEFVMNKALEAKVSAGDIVFEVTENSMIDNPELSIKKLMMIEACGFKFSIDDYGTGYSSLSYIKDMPIQEVKIDRTFIKDICNSDSDRTIVEATISMCHNLGYIVVAEGVEDEKSLEVLQDLSCDLIQGYFFSKPLPFNELAAFKKSFTKKYPSKKLRAT